MLWHSLQSRENPQQNPHCTCRSCTPAAPIPCALLNQSHPLHFPLDNGCKAENATGQVFCCLLSLQVGAGERSQEGKKGQLHNSQVSQKELKLSFIVFFKKYSTIMAQNTTTMYRDKAVLWAMTVDYSHIYIYIFKSLRKVEAWQFNIS